jgi:hypothetical protein
MADKKSQKLLCIQVLAQTIKTIILKLRQIVSRLHSMNVSARDRSEDQKMARRNISEIFKAVLL